MLVAVASQVGVKVTPDSEDNVFLLEMKCSHLVLSSHEKAFKHLKGFGEGDKWVVMIRKMKAEENNSYGTKFQYQKTANFVAIKATNQGNKGSSEKDSVRA